LTEQVDTEMSEELEPEYIPATLEEFLEFHDPTIQRVAKRKWGRQGFCEAEDVAQAIRLNVIEKWKRYEGLDANQATRYFEKAASQYLGKEAEDYMYFSGTYVYTPGQVRKHLERSTWSLIEEAPDVDARIDIKSAFENLSPARKAAVFRRFALKIPLEETTTLEQRNCLRGIDAITHWLNRREKPRGYTLDEVRQKLFGS
jgi:hypothetical protein